MNAAPGRVEENIARIQSFVRAASQEGADMVCFPELSVTGYTLKDPRDIYKERNSGWAIDQLIRMAENARLVILAGLIEISEGKGPYITQVVAGPKGLIGRYRKTHLSPHEKGIYKPGEKLEVFSYANTLFGIQLCYEAHFPEISTVMTLMGADILFIPHASPRGNALGKLNSWLRHLTARAFDNGIFVVACNQVGETEEGFSFPAVAVVLGPNGQELAKYTGEKEKILFAGLDARMLQEVREHRMKYFIPSRRPDLYGKIVS